MSDPSPIISARVADAIVETCHIFQNMIRRQAAAQERQAAAQERQAAAQERQAAAQERQAEAEAARTQELSEALRHIMPHVEAILANQTTQEDEA